MISGVFLLAFASSDRSEKPLDSLVVEAPAPYYIWRKGAKEPKTPTGAVQKSSKEMSSKSSLFEGDQIRVAAGQKIRLFNGKNYYPFDKKNWVKIPEAEMKERQVLATLARTFQVRNYSTPKFVDGVSIVTPIGDSYHSEGRIPIWLVAKPNAKIEGFQFLFELGNRWYPDSDELNSVGSYKFTSAGGDIATIDLDYLVSALEKSEHSSDFSLAKQKGYLRVSLEVQYSEKSQKRTVSRRFILNLNKQVALPSLLKQNKFNLDSSSVESLSCLAILEANQLYSEVIYYSTKNWIGTGKSDFGARLLKDYLGQFLISTEVLDQ